MNKDEDWLIAAKLSYVVMGNWIHDFFDRLPNTSIKNELYALYYNDSDKSENKRVFFAFHVLNRTAEDTDQFYGKAIFSLYVAENYSTIDFSGFRPFLDTINQVIVDYKKN